MDEDSSFPAQEEVVFLILHEIIDQMFDDGDDTKKKIKEEAYDSAEEVGDFPLDGAVAAIPPPAAMEPVPAVPPATALAPKRRRLGVNAGAHEQILRLRDALAYVTDERDMWKKRCREMEVCGWDNSLSLSLSLSLLEPNTLI